LLIIKEDTPIPAEVTVAAKAVSSAVIPRNTAFDFSVSLSSSISLGNSPSSPS
jgi:hypothetical protein